MAHATLPFSGLFGLGLGLFLQVPHALNRQRERGSAVLCDQKPRVDRVTRVHDLSLSVENDERWNSAHAKRLVETRAQLLAARKGHRRKGHLLVILLEALG